MVEAYPLYWPGEYPRTKHQKVSRFTTTLVKARDFVKDEIKRLGGKNPVISTNIPLKGDGDLRADWSKFRMDDTGVAVYFTHNGNQVCLCCDQYQKVWDNLHAVGRTIAALRQIDRDGVSDFLNRAFTGFKALPAESELPKKSIWEVLSMLPTHDTATITRQYRIRAKKAHPDAGGSQAEFIELQAAYTRAIEYANGETENTYI